MYDPRLPNVYDAVLASRAAAIEKPNPEGRSESLTITDDAAAMAALTLGSVADMTPEELRRQRVQASARLGVQSAIAQERLEHEASVRERRALGLDKESKVSNLLKRFGVMEGQALGGGGGLATHLVMEKSAMAAGGHVLVPSQLPTSTKPAVRGKPSSTLLLRNVAGPGAADLDELGQAIMTEAAKFGVVKAVRVHTLQQLPSGWEQGEIVRVLVRFDSAAFAFKASEALHHRLYDGRRIVVSFFPTPLFEKGDFGPHAEEDRLPVEA